MKSTLEPRTFAVLVPVPVPVSITVCVGSFLREFYSTLGDASVNMYIDKCSLVDLSRFANSVLAGRLFVRPTTVNHVVVVFSMKCIGFV